MATIQYTDEGQTLWKAYASVKSKINPTIRVQRWRFGLKTEKQAEREGVFAGRVSRLQLAKPEPALAAQFDPGFCRTIENTRPFK